MNNIVAEGKELQQEKIELKKAEVVELQKKLQQRSDNGRANKNDAWNYIPSTTSVKLGLTPT